MKFLITLFLTLFTSISFAAITYSQAVTSYPMSKTQDKVGFVVAVTNDAPAAGTFTCAASDICTKTAHGYVTGLKVQVSTSAADLPLNLLTVTDYFVIKIDADTFYLATSLVLAQAGTAVDIGDAGTGTHTITPTSLAGASAKLQYSMDNSAWADAGIKATGDATKSCSITATQNCYLNDVGVTANYIRVYYTMTAGQLTISELARTK